MTISIDKQADAQNSHPERFDPGDHAGRLMEAEHRARYWWAAQIAAGRDVLDAACGTGYGMEMLAAAGARSVTGVDLDPEAVAAARRHAGEGSEVHEADVRNLPFETNSFDLIACWETIEHVADGERVIEEFRRVLRPDGILLVSSPNPAVYPAGNEHHVHEYRPGELAALVGRHFDAVATYRQHPWLASAIDSAAETGGGDRSNGHRKTQVRAIAELEDGEETYGIVVAGHGDLSTFNELVVLGGDFEVRWWIERVESAEREAREAVGAVEVEAQRLLAEASAREGELRERLTQTADALYAANQALAQVPALRHQAEGAEARVEQAEAQTEAVRAVYERSHSWRLTRPLRSLTSRLRRG
jgi:2-polyprenyl-3-methyl-5-hydroxy-6-metoxy-1,4-benzoquinol methylase